MGTKQVETATVIGTVTSVGGNASVTITSAFVTGSPLAIAVTVAQGDTAADVAGKIRTALAYNSAVASQFLVSGSSADVVLTSHLERGNDASLNIAIDNGTCTGLTAAPTSADTQAGVGITNGYGTLAAFKTRFGVQGTDAARDVEIEAIIQGVSRAIDKYTGREFFSSAADEARYFTSEDYENLFTDDICSITSLKTDDDADGTFETTWQTSDYRTLPLNRTANITPIMWITLKPNGNYTFPKHDGGVEITGKFGYCTLANAPDAVREACYLQAHRIWMRQAAPFGVVGSADMGTVNVITQLDPDVKLMLEPYRRLI